jgi:hypothetical protein
VEVRVLSTAPLEKYGELAQLMRRAKTLPTRKRAEPVYHRLAQGELNLNKTEGLRAP